MKKRLFPDELEIARVFSIFKAGDKQLITNYRPISALNFFKKIVEKIVANCIVDFLDSNNILYKHQYGFKKDHSINHAVVTLVEKVAKALDTGKIVIGVNWKSKNILCHRPSYSSKKTLCARYMYVLRRHLYA